MTSSSTRELGPRFFVSARMSCIRSLASFLIFIAHGRGLFSCRAVDDIENLIPFPRQQSKAAMLQIADTEKLWIGPPRPTTAERSILWPR